MSMDWDEHEEVRNRRVTAGLCINCGDHLARPDRLLCWGCSEKVNAKRKDWQRRKKGYVPSLRRCGDCRSLGHDRRRCKMPLSDKASHTTSDGGETA